MNRNNHPEQFEPPIRLWIALAAAIVLGVGVLALGFILGSALDSWLWLVISFLTIGGIAQGMIVWAAVFGIAQVRWSSAINRLGHSAVGFLPVSFVIMLAILTGAENYMPWIAHPVPGKEAWLNLTSMVIRDIALVGALFLLSFMLVRRTLTADAKAGRSEEITPHDQYRLTALGIAVTIIYTITFTIISYDFIMSLSPEWVSTMFGPYFFITNLYVSLAALILLSSFLRKPLGVEPHIGPQQFHDMGNLMLGFGLFSMGLFFAQYLTIWYANIPFETTFLVERYYKGVWPALGWTAFIVGYAIPFLLLQSRELKRNPKWLSPVAVIAVIGVAAERYVLVVPSLRPDETMISPVPGLTILAFAAALVMMMLAFLRRYPPVSAAQLAIRETEPVEATL